MKTLQAIAGLTLLLPLMPFMALLHLSSGLIAVEFRTMYWRLAGHDFRTLCGKS